jgi:uncharacterized OB-fold protein
MPLTPAFGEVRRGRFPTLLGDTNSDAATEPFWEAARADRLVAPRCRVCGTFRLPPAPFCWVCQSQDVDWVDLPGTGTVYSFTVVRHPLHPDLSEVCPYVSAVVELDGTQGAGARMLVNVFDCDPDEVRIGTRVQVDFEHAGHELSTPRFRPLRPDPA